MALFQPHKKLVLKALNTLKDNSRLQHTVVSLDLITLSSTKTTHILIPLIVQLSPPSRFWGILFVDSSSLVCLQRYSPLLTNVLIG